MRGLPELGLGGPLRLPPLTGERILALIQRPPWLRRLRLRCGACGAWAITLSAKVLLRYALARLVAVVLGANQVLLLWRARIAVSRIPALVIR